MKKVFFTFLVLLITCGVLFSQDNPKVRTKKIADNIHLVNVAGVNSVILTGKEGTLLVDDNIEKNLLSRDEMLLGELHKAYPEYALPSITFKDKYEMSLNGETVVITSLSGGHSAGDVIVYFKNADVLHIGDIVFADMFPFVDTDHGGNAITLSDNIKTIIDKFTVNTKIIPGHGRMLTTEDLKEYRDMINGTIEIVKQEVSKNKSLSEIKESNLLNKYAEWQVAFNFDDWIEILYKSIEQK
jgi:cyclase